MNSHLDRLRRQRTKVFSLCIGYFLLLLAVGSWIFLKDSQYGMHLAAICLIAYLLVVRPVLNGYRQQLRQIMLETGIGKRLHGMTYKPEEGLPLETLEQSELFPVPIGSYLSRERIQGKAGNFQVTLADVTFPIRIGNRNEMFSGCAVVLHDPEHSFQPLRVEASQLISGNPDEIQQSLLKELCSWIPGNLYWNTNEQGIFVLLRGRFLGFKINALMDVTENTLSTDPLLELQQILELSRTLCQ